MTEILTEETQKGKIHKAMIAIMRDIGYVGKDQQASFGDRFHYRGIDSLYNALHPIMCKHGVYIRTIVRRRKVTERLSSNKNPMTVVALTVDHIFTQEDGSNVTVTTPGEAMDTSDKATNKALSAAMKYALIQTFAIPTAGAVDSETDNHGVASQQRPKPQPQSQGKQAEAAPTPPDPADQEKRPNEGTDKCHIESTWEKANGTKQNGVKWIKWAIKTDKGREYSTFSESSISIASDCMRGKMEAEITWERDQWGYQLVEIVPMQPPAAAASGEPTRMKVTCDIRNVTHSNEKGKDLWRVETSEGRFGCTDSDIAIFLRDFTKGTTPAILTYVTVRQGRKIVDIKADVPW